VLVECGFTPYKPPVSLTDFEIKPSANGSTEVIAPFMRDPARPSSIGQDATLSRWRGRFDSGWACHFLFFPVQKPENQMIFSG
jgi:hypothetical protein